MGARGGAPGDEGVAVRPREVAEGTELAEQSIRSSTRVFNTEKLSNGGTEGYFGKEEKPDPSSFLRSSVPPCENALRRDLLRCLRPLYSVRGSYNPPVTPTPHWVCDPELGERFVQTSLRFPPDYDGEVTATLVRNEPLVSRAKGAVLYLHGFIDYFFQSHLADAFNGAGYNFYALDLRKHGRSLGRGGAPELLPRLQGVLSGDHVGDRHHHDRRAPRSGDPERTLHRRADRRALREDRRSAGPRDPSHPQQSVSRVPAGQHALASRRVLGIAVSLRAHHGPFLRVVREKPSRGFQRRVAVQPAVETDRGVRRLLRLDTRGRARPGLDQRRAAARAAGPGHALRPVREGPDVVRDVSPGGSRARRRTTSSAWARRSAVAWRSWRSPAESTTWCSRARMPGPDA